MNIEITHTLTMNDVCRIAGGVSRWTILRWVEDGNFPKPKIIVPRRPRWSEVEVQAWVAAR